MRIFVPARIHNLALIKHLNMDHLERSGADYPRKRSAIAVSGYMDALCTN
jgi:hypothetical protein